jgi:hypothetical protein
MSPSSGQYSRFSVSWSHDERSSSGRVGGGGCRDTAAHHELQTAVKRMRSRGLATFQRTMPRSSSGRLDHSTTDNGELVPCTMQVAPSVDSHPLLLFNNKCCCLPPVASKTLWIYLILLGRD